MVKRDGGGKKGKLLHCQRIFDRIKVNLAEIQLKNAFLQKVPGVNWLSALDHILLYFALCK